MDLCLFLDHHKIDYVLHESVARLSYVGIGGKAALVIYPKNRGEMLCLLSYLGANGIPYKVIGNMSNLLPPDEFWNICLVSTKKMRALYYEKESVSAECGVPLSLLCRSMVLHRLVPMAELSGIPATVGGSVFQNAGAYGRCIADWLISADVYDPRSDRVVRLLRECLGFSYRRSELSSHGILLSATFSGCEGDPEEAHAAMQGFLKKRRDSQPSEPSLGSVFLRVGETSAAYYIEQAGLKGYRIGGAAVSEKHAGFIINAGGATAKDYRALIELIKQTVAERFGVSLCTEIEMIEEKGKNAWLRFA